MTDIEKLIEKTRASSFNIDAENVRIRFHRFVYSLLLYTHYGLEEIDNEQWLKDVVPEFQRENNKWTEEMQLKFVENLLSGVNTKICLFQMGEFGDAKIIDGLQRTTAILAFFDGKIKPFGYSYDQLKDSLRMFRTNLDILLYKFDNWEEVGRFYVDMNENITHSKEDIEKAKKWFLEEKGVTL